LRIACQDFLLAELPLQPKGDDNLLYLSFYCPIALQILELDVLLSDRAAALYHRASFEVPQECPSNPFEIDAEMIHEPSILN
jgi:hypothetical protein